MSYPQAFRYSKEHEWVRLDEDGTAVVGVTHFAQEQLGDIVYLALPEPGTSVVQFAKLGEVESVKAVSDIFSPLGGTVLEVNKEAVDHPEVVNQEPHGRGWLVKLKPGDLGGVRNLMTAQEYEAFLAADGTKRH
ncbi:MAG: glycine cleavage system protein GcvH [Chloroflexi bacterium]|nr:glycine cleavage system protein GcvH [Chloroflexota bacterium]